jgi:antitoxin component of RelBE/YafQ-DinJ toxin-antitoxin module
MGSVMMTIKTDPETREAVGDFARELGLTTTALVNALIRQALRDRRVVLSTEATPTPKFESMLQESDDDVRAGRVTVAGSRSELEAQLADLA